MVGPMPECLGSPPVHACPGPDPQVLYNPLWLLFLLMLFLFGKTVYQVGGRAGPVRHGSDAPRQLHAGWLPQLQFVLPGDVTPCAAASQPRSFTLAHPPTHIYPLAHPPTGPPTHQSQQEMDVEREMQRGLLPGAIALSSKFVPALKKVTAQTIDSTRRFLQEAPEAGGAGGSGGGQAARGGSEGAAVRQGDGGAAAGLRARGRREVELTEGGSLGVGTSRFGAEAAAAAGSRKDD